MKKINKNALGMSLGILLAGCMLFISILASFSLYTEAYEIMMKFHIFGDLTVLGTILGVIEAGIWGYITGFLFAWLYNKFSTN